MNPILSAGAVKDSQAGCGVDKVRILWLLQEQLKMLWLVEVLIRYESYDCCRGC